MTRRNCVRHNEKRGHFTLFVRVYCFSSTFHSIHSPLSLTPARSARLRREREGKNVECTDCVYAVQMEKHNISSGLASTSTRRSRMSLISSFPNVFSSVRNKRTHKSLIFNIAISGCYSASHFSVILKLRNSLHYLEQEGGRRREHQQYHRHHHQQHTVSRWNGIHFFTLHDETGQVTIFHFLRLGTAVQTLFLRLSSHVSRPSSHW